MTSIKSKLSDEEKKKVKKLSSLENTAAKQSVKSVKSTASATPIKYNKVEEGEKQKTTAEQIQAEADNYFSKLLNDSAQKTTDSQSGLESIQKEVSNTKSGVISNMPYKDGVEQSVTDSQEPKTIEELFKALEGINKSYENKSDKDYYVDLLPEVKDSLGLQKLDNVTIDEDEVRRQVEAILTGEYNKKKQSAVDNANREIESEKQNQVNLINSAEANKEEITELYDQAKIEASNTSLKRGLARSSIAVLSINGLEKEKVEELSNLAVNLRNALDQSENDIRKLRDELEVALENLDIDYAMDVSTEIKKEIEKLYDKQKEVVSFNNNVDKLEADYQTKRNSLIEERNKMESKLAEEYKGVAERDRTSQITDAVVNYLSSLPKAEAIKELASDSRFIEYLGTGFYDVYYKLMRGE